MRIVPVQDSASEKTFLEINPLINRGNPDYIRPLDKDVQEVFDPERNKTFRFGKVQRWILLSADGAPIGRIAAFVNKRYRNKGDDLPVGGVGFFDSVNDPAAAALLFDTAKAWLQAEGMEAMDGPINFGERDRWWGVVVQGFQSPLYCMNYNPPYYQQLFEGYGFQPFFHQICLGMDPKSKLKDKIWERVKPYESNPDFSARMIEKDKLEKYAADFVTVYNKAWAGHGGMKEMRKEQAAVLFKKMKPVMDERLIWFAYHKEDPVAIFINLPDLNQWFRHLNGRFDLLHKLKFLWVKATKPNPKFTGLVFGIVPEFQGKGMDSFIISEAAKVVQRPQVSYKEYEMQWIGDFNPKMLNVAISLGEVFESRRLTTYRFLFDRNRPFQRHPILS